MPKLKPVLKYIRLLLMFLPVIFAVWAYLNAGGAGESKDAHPAAADVAVSSESGTVDDFIAAGELDEFSSASGKKDEDEFLSAGDFEEFSPTNTTEEAKTSSAGGFKVCDDSCSSQCSKESVSRAAGTDLEGSGSGDDAGSPGDVVSTGIFGIDKFQALVMFISFAGVIVSGYLVRRALTRKVRIFFMLAGLLFFGFYLGGCPCPIMGIFKFFQFVRGDQSALPILIWTAGILFLTYFVGKSWCGWLCPLGGLQELIHKPGLLPGAKNQTVLIIFRMLRIVLLVFLSLFVLITGVNLLSKYDPFKSIFNLFYGGASLAVWIAVALLMLSAPLIYRPFCKTICPLGLLMGFVSRIPGARKIIIGDSCKDCRRCQKNCPSDAIIINNGERKVITEDCILCGDCLDECGHLSILGKKRNHNDSPKSITKDK